MITIGGTTYALAANTDREALEEELLRAVRSGGMFVDLRIAGSAPLRLLVSAGIPVILSTVDVPIRSVGDDDGAGARLDAYEDFDATRLFDD
ncbi:hypothetical protein HQQ81_21685 [Microbacteriaceae bacterium VKM Ac-2854]|nr:hypothetical protein [Microbacteriaceae bacterium VKM Ac-2854]